MTPLWYNIRSMSKSKESAFVHHLIEKNIKPPQQGIIFMGHTLEPITRTYTKQEEIHKAARLLAQTYEHVQAMNTLTTVEFTDQVIRLLFETTSLPDTARLNTSVFLQKIIYNLTSEKFHGDLDRAADLRGIMREANALSIWSQKFQVYRSSHLDYVHKIDFIISNGTKCLPVNVKGPKVDSAEIIPNNPPVWRVGVPYRTLYKSSALELYSFPFGEKNHPREYEQIMKLGSVGMQTTEVAKDLLPLPSDPHQSLDMEQCYLLH